MKLRITLTRGDWQEWGQTVCVFVGAFLMIGAMVLFGVPDAPVGRESAPPDEQAVLSQWSRAERANARREQGL